MVNILCVVCGPSGSIPSEANEMHHAKTGLKIFLIITVGKTPTIELYSAVFTDYEGVMGGPSHTSHLIFLANHTCLTGITAL